MAQYLKYTLVNTEPLRIADDSASQSGQTAAIRYIPGSAVRGLVVNALSRKNHFEQIKKLLFSNHVQYLNAYISAGKKELIPSPKGFYENKVTVSGEKEIQNVVVDGAFSDGYKRAALGRYCYIENGCIHYYPVDMGSDMKIKINVEKEKKNVFRNEYITENHIFTGYIMLDDICMGKKEGSQIMDDLHEIFEEKKEIFLGNARTSGFGGCRVVSCETTEELPYQEYMEENDVEGSCYMLLLSNLTMRNSCGEICGIDKELLEKKMGVKALEILFCSTSAVTVRGYNRTWGTKIPSAVMFEQGSVFHMKFEGTLKKETMMEIASQGLGIRVNEGFGRVLFLKNYEEVTRKQEEIYDKKYFLKQQEKEHAKAGEMTEADKKTLFLAAKSYYRNLLHQAMQQYIVKHPMQKGSVSKSQLGNIEAMIMELRYQPQKAAEKIEQHFEHAVTKENKNNIQKKRNSISTLEQEVKRIQNTELDSLLEIKGKDTVMGIDKNKLLSKEDKLQMKWELLLEMIRYDNKKEADAQ